MCMDCDKQRNKTSLSHSVCLSIIGCNYDQGILTPAGGVSQQKSLSFKGRTLFPGQARLVSW